MTPSPDWTPADEAAYWLWTNALRAYAKHVEQLNKLRRKRDE